MGDNTYFLYSLFYYGLTASPFNAGHKNHDGPFMKREKKQLKKEQLYC